MIFSLFFKIYYLSHFFNCLTHNIFINNWRVKFFMKIRHSFSKSSTSLIFFRKKCDSTRCNDNITLWGFIPIFGIVLVRVQSGLIKKLSFISKTNLTLFYLPKGSTTYVSFLSYFFQLYHHKNFPNLLFSWLLKVCNHLKNVFTIISNMICEMCVQLNLLIAHR